MPYHVHLEDSPFHSALKPLQLEVGTFKVAVPMLCGLVPKAPFSAVVTSSYSVAKGRGMRREGGGGGGEGRGGEGKGGRGRGGRPENQFKQYYVQHVLCEITPLHALASGSVHRHLMTRGSIDKA